MDQAASTGRQELDTPLGKDQQKSPQELRSEIEQTRVQLGDTVEALAEKADVKSQAQQRISQVKDTASQKRDELLAKGKLATPASAGAGAQQVASRAQEKPALFAAGTALAAGLLLGLLIGRRRENQ
jgi:ElaB/YqjD/DUF883 family membrane-anchored ribosome-binding protein